MNDWAEKLRGQLDRNKPGWEFDWADAEDLRVFAREDNAAKLRLRVSNKLFHTILHAAIEAGIVKSAN